MIRSAGSVAVSINVALMHSTDPGRVGPKSKLLCDEWLATEGIRASTRQHPVQHRYAAGSLSLLDRETVELKVRCISVVARKR
jgi:hypothetical protein